MNLLFGSHFRLPPLLEFSQDRLILNNNCMGFPGKPPPFTKMVINFRNVGRVTVPAMGGRHGGRPYVY